MGQIPRIRPRDHYRCLYRRSISAIKDRDLRHKPWTIKLNTMKMTIIKNIIIASFVLLSISSCKRVLDTEPVNTLDGTTRFKTISDFDFAITGAYALFMSGTYYGSSYNDL